MYLFVKYSFIGVFMHKCANKIGANFRLRFDSAVCTVSNNKRLVSSLLIGWCYPISKCGLKKCKPEIVASLQSPADGF